MNCERPPWSTLCNMFVQELNRYAVTKQVAHVAVSNPQLVTAEWALGPPPDSQSASYFHVTPCAGTLAPGQSAFVQVCLPHAILHCHSWHFSLCEALITQPICFQCSQPAASQSLKVDSA